VTPTPAKPAGVDARFTKIVRALASLPGVTPPADPSAAGHRFGASGLKINGKLFALISSKRQFVVKLPRERVTELVRARVGKPFDPGHGRLMKEWLALGKAGDTRWLALAKEAMAFVGSR
jgi:hypothetical protein